MLVDDDRAWLKELEGELWPPKDEDNGPLLRRLDVAMGRPPRPKPPEPRELVTREELTRIFKIVEEAPLLTALFSHGYICGVGITLYEHELFPGAGPQELFHLTDDHLPRLDDRSVYEVLRGAPPKPPRKHAMGDVRGDVWELFTKYTHSQRNREWLKQYKIQMRFDKHSYDY